MGLVPMGHVPVLTATQEPIAKRTHALEWTVGVMGLAPMGNVPVPTALLAHIAVHHLVVRRTLASMDVVGDGAPVLKTNMTPGWPLTATSFTLKAQVLITVRVHHQMTLLEFGLSEMQVTQCGPSGRHHSKPFPVKRLLTSPFLHPVFHLGRSCSRR